MGAGQMRTLPFAAFVGMEELKRALLALAVDPGIGGLLISGPKGTGKSSIVRAFAELLPEIEVVADCPFNCDPRRVDMMCDVCRSRVERGERLPVARVRMRVVDLPVGATEDMVLGTINLERTLREGRVVFEPGLLGRANRQILYVDEVNLLPDHIVDAILDAAASGWNVVEREGVSLRHPSRFILVGTMNPEEGELRPQLLDRFAICVRVETIRDPRLRAEIVRRNLELESDPAGFAKRWEREQERLRRSIERARSILPSVKVPDHVISSVVRACAALEVDGYRPDITAVRVARALAALDGRREVTHEDALSGLLLALAHRTRAGGLKPPPSEDEVISAYSEALPQGRLAAEMRREARSTRFFRS
ncbi:MAG: magnesium chelatase ATPase subunit I [Thermoprotei archaeon]|nr:MAG: magnesium chelatase ATPase subunit I [Thermoprotei archaeon]